MNELEQKYVSLQREYHILISDRKGLTEQITLLSNQLHSDQDRIGTLEKQQSVSELEIKQKTLKLQELSETIEQLQSTLARRSDECERLREQLKSQANDLFEQQKITKDLQIKYIDLQSEIIPKQFELSKLSQERDYFEKELQFHRSQLLTKENEERAYRKESSENISRLENEIHSLKHSLEEQKHRNTILTTEHSSQEEKIRYYIQKTKEIENELFQQQSTFEQENTNVKKLMNLYKSHFDEATVKIEELEKINEQQKENFRLFQLKKDEELRTTVDEWKKQEEKEKSVLTQKISELEQALADKGAAVGEKTFAGKPYEIISSSNANSGLDDLSITEVYHQLMRAQRDFIQEQSKRQETEVYLSQILKDIEAKAPLIAKQKRDYQRIVQSHSQLTEALDSYAEENTRLKVTIHDLEAKLNQSNKELKVVSVTNADLIQQVHHLLKVNQQVSAASRHPFASPPSGEFGSGELSVHGNHGVAMIEDESSNNFAPQDIISTHLVTFSNIEELQAQNLQLLQTIRRLTTEREQQEAVLLQLQEQRIASNSVHGADGSQLSDLQRQLNVVRADQEKSEEMMKVLIQQRDMYRSMVTTGDYSRDLSPLSPGSRSIGQSSASAVIVHHSSPNKRSDDQEVEIIQLRSKLNTLTHENEQLRDRMSRFEDSDSRLNEELTKTKEELVKSKILFSNHQTELRFTAERNDRLENQLKLLQRENIESLQRRSELEENILSLQKELRNKDDNLHQSYQELRLLRDQYRQKEIEFEVSKNSETRLLSQLSELKEELRRNSSLAEHLHRIESSLSARAEEDKEFHRQENESLKTSFEQYRKTTEEKLISQDQVLRIQEKDIKLLTSKVETKEQELQALQQSLLHEQSLHQVATERIHVLERQISIQQEKLNQSTGSTIVESVIEKELNEKEIQLSKALNEIETLKSLLHVAESHVEQFKRISSANEVLVKEIKEKQREEIQNYQLQYQQAVNEIERMKEERSSSQLSSNQLLNDLENSRKELQQSQLSYQENLHHLQVEVQRLLQENSTLQSSFNVMREDMEKLQQSSVNSFENYERELQLHADAEKKVREEKNQHLKTKEKLLAAEEKIGELSAGLIQLQQKSNDELHASKNEIQRLNEFLANLQQSNDLLHSQIQSYGSQLEKFQNERFAALVASTDDPSETAGVTSANAARNSSSVEDLLLQQEISELKKNSSEMRELLRYLKRDKEMLQAKLQIVESENNRYHNQLQTFTKTIEELRQELKQEMEKKTSFRSEEEFQLLTTEIQQLNILRESNLHLRKENEDIQKKWKALQEQLDEERKKVQPLQETIRQLSNDKDALELSNDQLTNDIAYWKNRLHSLVSRYNDIDPHEHQQLVVKLEESKASIQALQEKIQELENSRNDALQSKENEIASAKKAAEGFEKNADQLRERLRLFKDKHAELDTKIKELNKVNAAREAAHVTLEQHYKEAQVKISELTAEVADLKTNLQAATAAAAASVAASTSTAVVAAPDSAVKAVPPRGVGGRGAGRGAKRPPLPATAPPVAAAPTSTETADSTIAVAPTVPAQNRPPLPTIPPPANLHVPSAAAVEPITAVTVTTTPAVVDAPKSLAVNAMKSLLQKRKTITEETTVTDPSAMSVPEKTSEDHQKLKRAKIEEKTEAVIDSTSSLEPVPEIKPVEQSSAMVVSSNETPLETVANDKIVKEPETLLISQPIPDNTPTFTFNAQAAPFTPFNSNPFASITPSIPPPGSVTSTLFGGIVSPNPASLPTIPETLVDFNNRALEEVEEEQEEEVLESQPEHGDVEMTEEGELEDNSLVAQEQILTQSAPKSLFGSTAASSSIIGFDFKAASSTSVSGTSSIFGSFVKSSAASSGGLFGSTSGTSAAVSTGNIFGVKVSTSNSAPFGSLFKTNSSGSESQVTTVFGGQPFSNAAPTQSLFGVAIAPAAIPVAATFNDNRSKESVKDDLEPQESLGDEQLDSSAVEDKAQDSVDPPQQNEEGLGSPQLAAAKGVVVNNNPFSSVKKVDETTKMEQRAMRFLNPPATATAPVTAATVPPAARLGRAIPIIRTRASTAKQVIDESAEQKEE